MSQNSYSVSTVTFFNENAHNPTTTKAIEHLATGESNVN
jgi:hypothetical protein